MKKAMKVLLAVDGSEYGMAAVEEAARLPWPQGTLVRIISVTELPSVAFVEKWERIFEERSISIVTQALARFGEIAGARTEVATKTLIGDPKISILDEAEHWGADLILVGTHGYNAIKRLWLGSVSHSIISHAKCSVQVARKRQPEESAGSGMKILVAVDGSETSTEAVKEIASRPWPQDSEVKVISAIHLPFTPTPETWALPESYYSQLENAGRQQAESAVNAAIALLRESNAKRQTPLALTGSAIPGRAQETIIETAKTWGADLIVLGSHGYRGVERFLLGSVSQAVAIHAPCSVEIVRPASEKERQ